MRGAGRIKGAVGRPVSTLARPTPQQRAILDYMDLYPSRVTSHEISMALGISLTAANERLCRMWRLGWLRRRKVTLRGSIYEWEYDLLTEWGEAA